MHLFRSLLLGLLLGQALTGSGADSQFIPKVVVHAGDQTRLNTIVTFKLPPHHDQLKALKDARGNLTETQIDSDGVVTFMEDYLQKGGSKTYLMDNYIPPGKGGRDLVRVVQEGSQVRLMAEGLGPIFYQTKPSALPKGVDPAYRRGGYLHPIHSPSGLIVTDDYPTNHLHHHGIWFAWTKTKFLQYEPDFWNMGQKKGRVEFDGVEAMWDGPVVGGLRVRHLFREMFRSEQATVLNETWEIRLYRAPKRRPGYTVFDITSRQRCATLDPLILPPYHYGGLGFRGNGAWDGATNATFLTSEGETDRVKGNETRGRWCHIGGQVKGKDTGMLIMCHPDNYRAPQPMRLHPTEPFFCYAPQQIGEMEIAPGNVYVSRYRCVVIDGPPDRDLFEQLYYDYANPPKVEVLPR